MKLIINFHALAKLNIFKYFKYIYIYIREYKIDYCKRQNKRNIKKKCVLNLCLLTVTGL